MALMSALFSGNQRLAAAARNNPALHWGEVGDAVTKFQLGLITRGYPMPISTKKMGTMPDGIFGNETKNSTRNFQRVNNLRMDGLPGEKTLTRLDSLLARPVTNAQPACSNCSTQNTSKAAAITAKVKKMSLPGGIEVPSNLRLLTAQQQATARRVYRDSLDFSKIYISDGLGFQGRGFTVAIGGQVVINCGTFSPSTRLLIHELAHAWQSQHNPSDPRAFMTNSVASQGLAEVAKGLGLGDASPYAYVPGKPFADYGAEQIAQQVQNGEVPIISHVASVPKNAPDAANVASLNMPRWEIIRAPGVKI